MDKKFFHPYDDEVDDYSHCLGNISSSRYSFVMAIEHDLMTDSASSLYTLRYQNMMETYPRPKIRIQCLRNDDLALLINDRFQ